MSSASLADQVSFLREIEKLKGVNRANKTVDGRYENSAEHSWHVALMALLLEEHASDRLDMLQVVRLLLIHDIVEIDAGDTSIYAPDQESKLADETRAAERIFALLPGKPSKTVSGRPGSGMVGAKVACQDRECLLQASF